MGAGGRGGSRAFVGHGGCGDSEGKGGVLGYGHIADLEDLAYWSLTDDEVGPFGLASHVESGALHKRTSLQTKHMRVGEMKNVRK